MGSYSTVISIICKIDREIKTNNNLQKELNKSEKRSTKANSRPLFASYRKLGSSRDSHRYFCRSALCPARFHDKHNPSERFGIEGKNSAMASRIIRDTLSAQLIDAMMIRSAARPKNIYHDGLEYECSFV